MIDKMTKRTEEQAKVKQYEYRIVKNDILKNSGLLKYWNIGIFAGMPVKRVEQL
jgi:hypothetical protein